MLTVDVKIQGQRSRPVSRDLAYLDLFSCYQKYLCVYIHVTDIKNHNKTTENYDTCEVDL